MKFSLEEFLADPLTSFLRFLNDSPNVETLSDKLFKPSSPNDDVPPFPKKYYPLAVEEDDQFWEQGSSVIEGIVEECIKDIKSERNGDDEWVIVPETKDKKTKDEKEDGQLRRFRNVICLLSDKLEELKFGRPISDLEQEEENYRRIIILYRVCWNLIKTSMSELEFKSENRNMTINKWVDKMTTKNIIDSNFSCEVGNLDFDSFKFVFGSVNGLTFEECQDIISSSVIKSINLTAESSNKNLLKSADDSYQFIKSSGLKHDGLVSSATLSLGLHSSFSASSSVGSATFLIIHFMRWLMGTQGQNPSAIQEAYSVIMDIISGCKSSSSPSTFLFFIPFLSLAIRLIPFKRAPCLTNCIAFILSTHSEMCKLRSAGQGSLDGKKDDASLSVLPSSTDYYYYYLSAFLFVLGPAALEVQPDDSHAVGRSMIVVFSGTILREILCRNLKLRPYELPDFQPSRDSATSILQFQTPELAVLLKETDTKTNERHNITLSMVQVLSQFFVSAQPSVFHSVTSIPMSLPKKEDKKENEMEKDSFEEELSLLEISPLTAAVSTFIIQCPDSKSRPKIFSHKFLFINNCRTAFHILSSVKNILAAEENSQLTLGFLAFHRAVRHLTLFVREDVGDSVLQSLHGLTIPIPTVIAQILNSMAMIQEDSLKRLATHSAYQFISLFDSKNIYELFCSLSELDASDFALALIINQFKKKLQTDKIDSDDDQRIRLAMKIIIQTITSSKSTIVDSSNSINSALNLLHVTLKSVPKDVIFSPKITKIETLQKLMGSFKTRLETEITLYPNPPESVQLSLLVFIFEDVMQTLDQMK